MLTWIEINKKAIEHNIKQFRNIVGGNCLVMPVIKANAYGHGFLGIANILQQNKNVDRLCVVNANEALELITKFKKSKPIQILSYYEFDENILLKLAKNHVIFPVFTLKQAKFLNKVGERAKKKIKVHIKVDVGTSRIGILENDIKNFVIEIKKLKNIFIEGVFSHFSSSEESREVTNRQIDSFKKIIFKIEELGVKLNIKHITCSAASILYAQSHFNAIRMGISVYGLYPSPETKKMIKLKPALSWYTKIIALKQVPSGTKIGYNGTYTANRPTKVATLPVGYYDGFDRSFSNKAEVLVRGINCKVLGNICMNLAMIDVTNVPNVSEWDTVCLIGKQKNGNISVEDMAMWANTINYEIVDRINPLIPRIYK